MSGLYNVLLDKIPRIANKRTKKETLLEKQVISNEIEKNIDVPQNAYGLMAYFIFYDGTHIDAMGQAGFRMMEPITGNTIFWDSNLLTEIQTISAGDYIYLLAAPEAMYLLEYSNVYNTGDSYIDDIIFPVRLNNQIRLDFYVDAEEVEMSVEGFWLT